MRFFERLYETFLIPKPYHVMARYREIGIVQNQQDAELLTMFFSPMSVPCNLTHEEVRLCIALYPLRQAQHRKQPNLPLTRLPTELSTGGRVTREGFLAGIRKFLATEMPIRP